MNQYYNHTGPYGYPLSPHGLEPYRRPLRQWSNYICIALILLQVISFILYTPLYYLYESSMFKNLSQPLQNLLDQSLTMAVYLLVFWIPTLILIRWIRIPTSVSFPLRRPRASIAVPAVFVCLGASVLGQLLSGGIAVFMESIFGLTPTMPDMSNPVGVGSNVVYVISMTFVPAIFEELLFRGVIMQSLRRFGDGFALLISAALFGLIHGNLIQGPNAMLLGLVIGYFVLRTGSLVTGIIIHFVNNSLAVLSSYLADYLISPQQADNFYLGIYGVYAITGGIALVYLLMRHASLFRVAPSNYPLSSGKKNVAFFSTAGCIVFLILTLILVCTQFERI